MNLKILGSEPAAIASGVETAAAAVLALLLAFHAAGLTAGDIGLIMAALTAVAGTVVAFVTHHPALSGVVAAGKACAALAIGFGVHLSPQDIAVILGAVTAVGGLFLRTQTSSKRTALTRASAGAPAVLPGRVVSSKSTTPAKTTRKRPAAKKTTTKPATATSTPPDSPA